MIKQMPSLVGFYSIEIKTRINKESLLTDQLERMVHDIEFATVQKKVIDGLKDGNVALEKANAVFSIDEIENIMADTQEAVEKQREIDALISGQLTEEGESAVVEELDKLLMSDLDPVISDLPTVPTDKVETIEDQLPEVPASVSQIICRNICKHNILPFLFRNPNLRTERLLLLPIVSF